MNKNTCNICKIRAYIQCDQCDNPLYFCSRGHLHTHKIKMHTRNNSNSLFNEISFSNHNKQEQTTQEQKPSIDLRKLFEHIQTLKKDIDMKINTKNYVEAVLLINKCLPLAKKFYQEDHIFNLELLFRLSESYIQISNLEEAINNLEDLLNLTQNTRTDSINMMRYKSLMLIGGACINLGDYPKALKSYSVVEQEVVSCFTEPELNIKQAAINLNLGICHIYMGNPNISEKFLKKGITQTDGMLGNDIIYKLNADLNENMGVIYEQQLKSKESLNYYKKSLKTKFNLYGENHEEVLELQYKISSIYITNKQFKEAEEIMTAMTDVILKEKLLQPQVDNFFRYGVYFYTTGMILLKNNKSNLAKEYLNKANFMWKDILNSNDPAFSSLTSLLKLCDKKIN